MLQVLVLFVLAVCFGANLEAGAPPTSLPDIIGTQYYHSCMDIFAEQSSRLGVETSYALKWLLGSLYQRDGDLYGFEILHESKYEICFTKSNLRVQFRLQGEREILAGLDIGGKEIYRIVYYPNGSFVETRPQIAKY